MSTTDMLWCAILQGKRVAISGSGNVAIYAAEKCMQLGAKVVTLSDSNGVFYEEDGFTREGLSAVDDLKVTRKGKLSEHSSKTGASLHDVTT